MDVNVNRCLVLGIIILYVSFIMACRDLNLQIRDQTKAMVGLSALSFMIGVIIS